MRYVLFLTSVALLCGCTTTQVIDADWNDPTIRQVIAQIGQYDSGRVLLHDSAIQRTGPFVVSDSAIEFLDPGYRVDRRQVAEIRVTLSKGRRRGFRRGALIGAASWVGLGIGYTYAALGECPIPVCSVALIGAAPDIVLAFGLEGALVGGVIGALVGARRVEVLRFRPDTPRQISVIIGISPPSRGLAGANSQR